MHFWRSRGPILHKLSKILLSGEIYLRFAGNGTPRWQRRKTNVSRVEDGLTNHSLYLFNERWNHWHDSSGPAMVIVSIQVATLFAPEGCDNLVWRASHYFINMSWSISRLKDLVSQAIRFLHPYYLSEDSSKQTSKFGWKMKLSP